MPDIPQRKLSKGERLNHKRERKFRKKMKWQAQQQRATVRRIISERQQKREALRNDEH